jgi:flagellar hook-associated protein 3 FlgL
MRLSTNQMFNANVAGYQKGYAGLVKTQEQITSGNRIQTPADDPVGSARLLQLEQQQALLGQYKNNLTDATNSLTQEHSILDSLILVSQRARELAGHAGNGAYSDHDRKAIALELQQIENELFGLMNSKDASGDYWFSGSQSGTQPYVRNSDGTYSYQGDESQRSLQVATGMQISIGDSGYDAFESARNVSRTETNIDAVGVNGQRMYLSQGTISTQRDFDSGFRAGAPYRLEVSGDPATGAISYQVFDRNNAPVPVQNGGVGTYDPLQENPKINFHGVEFTFDTLLKEGESATDYAALLDGHSFEIGMAPDRFAVAGNSTTSQITASSVVDADAYAAGFPAGGVTLQFTSPTNFEAFAQPGNIKIGDQGSIPGTIPGSITIAGVELTIAGTPAANDQFKISADSQETQNILNTIVELRKALEQPADGIEGGGLRIREAVANALGNIDSGMIQIESTQAHIGARLNSIDTLSIENESLEIFNATTQSAIRDTDQFEAASRLILQETKLEAAMAAFMRVSQLSLFDRM